MRKNNLSLELFLSAAEDFELAEYQILGILKKIENKLHLNYLMPHFIELEEICFSLRQILNNQKLIDKSNQNENYSHIEKSISDEEENQEFFKKILTQYQLEQKENKPEDKVFDIINKYLPKLESLLNEAKAIFEFALQNIEIEEVGISPLYKNEGYLFLQTDELNETLVFRYASFLSSAGNIPIQFFKTQMIRRFPLPSSFSEIKLKLLREFKDLPNPATYKCYFAFSFPIEETVLPAAKKKLIDFLAA